MFESLQLTDRHEQVLSATVRRYVATAEPVSSKFLAEERAFAVSAATIRNAMGWLEKAGLLVQPHTSAGRVPSDLGYRLYVDRLMVPDERFGLRAERRLGRELKASASSIEALLDGVARILATVSGYIALVAPPQKTSQRLRHLQLVSVDTERVLLAIVTETYETQSVLVSVDALSQPSTEDLQALSNFLSDRLQGLSPEQPLALDWSGLDGNFQEHADFLQHVAVETAKRLQPSEVSQVIVRGIAEALHQPEFTETERVQMLLHLLEAEQTQLAALMAQNEGVVIHIGAENPLESLQDCALVAARYRASEHSEGSVGVIGPTRMLYEGAVAAVEAAAGYLSTACRLSLG